MGGAANGGASLGGGGGGAPAQPPNVSRYIYTGQGTDNTSSVTAVNAAGRDAAEGNLSQGQAFGLVENGSPTTYWIWYGPGVVKRIG
ncbi:MAG: hypothetical protein ABI583_09175 [Betaproteobacteria bacterium]